MTNPNTETVDLPPASKRISPVAAERVISVASPATRALLRRAKVSDVQAGVLYSLARRLRDHAERAARNGQAAPCYTFLTRVNDKAGRNGSERAAAALVAKGMISIRKDFFAYTLTATGREIGDALLADADAEVERRSQARERFVAQNGAYAFEGTITVRIAVAVLAPNEREARAKLKRGDIMSSAVVLDGSKRAGVLTHGVEAVDLLKTFGASFVPVPDGRKLEAPAEKALNAWSAEQLVLDLLGLGDSED